MQNNCTSLLFFILLLTWTSSSCTKKETITIPDNEPSPILSVEQIRIENYINRVFIDLIGREPLDVEMDQKVDQLKQSGFTAPARETLISSLQNDESFIEGDTSYKQAYHQNLYNLAKIRCLEGASDAFINEFIEGNDSEEAIQRLTAVLNARKDMQQGHISYHQLFARVIYNDVYDEINMNTFNFVNATFDNLLFRFPTNAELQAGFNMVEDNLPETIFGQTGQNKTDYVNIITASVEMSEGLIIWAYNQLLARNPTTEETIELLDNFHTGQDFSAIQLHIMSSDEYANF